MQAAERIPEEKIFTNECWSLILGEILTGMKPYLDIEIDVMMEEFVFKCKRESKETMSSYVTRKMNKHRDLQQAMGKKQVVCPHCQGDFTTNNDFPDEFLAHLWRKDAQLSDDNRSKIHLWVSGKLNSQRTIEMLLRLDRADALVAQALAGSGDNTKTAYVVGDSSST